MSALKLYNSLSNRKTRFLPRNGNRVKLFTCGPSVYRKQHIGNFRTFLFEDVLQAYLEYLGFKVDRVINFTDIEDKAIEEARQKGISLEELRRPVEDDFFENCARLGIKLPDPIPRATTSVDAAVDMVQRLMARGHAYRHDGEIFFDPLTYDGFGRLYGLDMRRWPDKKIRFRRDTYRGHRWNLGDFILWHKSGPRDLAAHTWESAIGRGRPAWNIQDAAMIREHLGFEIDIHAGGIDNLYRHHDYTLAIMEGASGKTFCPWWLHGGHLLVNGRKMSKSKGNVTYVGDLLNQGFLPRHIRFFLLYGPYRRRLNLSMARLDQCSGYLDRIHRQVDVVMKPNKAGGKRHSFDLAERMRADFERSMNDDLDYAGAFDAVAGHMLTAVRLEKTGTIRPRERDELYSVLKDIDGVLGVLGCR